MQTENLAECWINYYSCASREGCTARGRDVITELLLIVDRHQRIVLPMKIQYIIASVILILPRMWCNNYGPILNKENSALEDYISLSVILQYNHK